MVWSPAQYEKFKGERQQPFFDLLALVEPRPDMRVVDLGCGTGELTRTLHEQLKARETLGVDESEAMLRKAEAFTSCHPEPAERGEGSPADRPSSAQPEGVLRRATPAQDDRTTRTLRFARSRVEDFHPAAPSDLVFSNAALHWVPEHEQLLVRLTSMLADGGQLAVQMPANDDHLSHLVAAEVAREFGVAPRPDFLLPPARYAELLHRLGYARQHVRLQIYGHRLDSAADVVEWVRGALLTHYEALLPTERFREFVAAYTARLTAALGAARPYFYTYKRIHLWGSLPA